MMAKINYLELKGLIFKESGEEFSVEKFFNFLNENGYEFTGTLDRFSDAQMKTDIEKIVSCLTVQKFLKMKEIHDNHYGTNKASDFIHFLLDNTGTSIYDEVTTSVLEEETLKLYKKYSNANWEISDIFEADYSEAVVSKMKELNVL